MSRQRGPVGLMLPRRNLPAITDALNGSLWKLGEEGSCLSAALSVWFGFGSEEGRQARAVASLCLSPARLWGMLAP